MKEFFLKLPQRLRNMGCWLYRELKGTAVFYADANAWRGVGKTMKAIYPACKELFGVVFKGKKGRSISLKKGLLGTPGGGNLLRVAKRAVIGGIFTGIIIGLNGGALLLNNDSLLLLFAISLFLLIILPALFYQMDDFARGLKGERAVAEKLAEYENRVRGNEVLWKSFHSFFIPNQKYGDIDHIVVCTHGVFCLETKNPRRKKIEINPDTGETSPVKNETVSAENGGKWECPTGQAKWNAKRLRNFLNEKGASVEFVVPVVFLVEVFTPEDSTPEDYIYVTKNLIVGNSENIGLAFTKFAKQFGEQRQLSRKEFTQIRKILDKENRSDPEEQPPPD